MLSDALLFKFPPGPETSPSLAEHACRALATLAQVCARAYSHARHATPGLPPRACVLRRWVQALRCRASHHGASSSPLQDVPSKVLAARNDSLEAVMRALVDYPSDLGVQEQGFRALAALNAIKAQGAENQGRAVVAGAVEVGPWSPAGVAHICGSNALHTSRVLAVAVCPALVRHLSLPRRRLRRRFWPTARPPRSSSRPLPPSPTLLPATTTIRRARCGCEGASSSLRHYIRDA